MGINIIKNEPPASAVAVQNQLRVPWSEQGSDFINQFFDNLRVTRGVGAPRRPAPSVIFEISHHHGSASHHPSQEPCLSTDMLYVIMPVITLLQLLAESLFNCVAVGKCIKNKQHPVIEAKSRHGGVDENSCASNRIFNYNLLFVIQA